MKWYAEISFYGNVDYTSLDGGAYTFFAFSSKTERDRFVDWISEQNLHNINFYASAITAKELRYALSEAGYKTDHGKPFVLDSGVIAPDDFDPHFDYEWIETMNEFSEAK